MCSDFSSVNLSQLPTCLSCLFLYDLCTIIKLNCGWIAHINYNNLLDEVSQHHAKLVKNMNININLQLQVVISKLLACSKSSGVQIISKEIACLPGIWCWIGIIGVLVLVGGGGLLLLGVSGCRPGVEWAGGPWRVLRLRPAYKPFLFAFNFRDGQTSIKHWKASQTGRISCFAHKSGGGAVRRGTQIAEDCVQ